MALEDSVNDLVDATTSLLTAVNVSKATLDASVASAADSATVTTANATSATNSASAAATSATNAANSATQAANSAASAAAIVTGVASNRPSIRPSLLLDFANTKQLDQRVTFSRASSGTFFDQNGRLTPAIAGVSRFDHDPVTGESKGLLIEEQRTNLLTYSEQFDNAAWGKSGSTVTANVTTAPDGTTTADTLVEALGAGTHLVARTVASTVNTLPHTISFYAKASTRTSIYTRIVEGTTFARQGDAVFNLSTGTITYANTGSGGATGGLGTITSVGNGWYRCSYTLTLGGTDTNTRLEIALYNGSISYTGDGTSGLYIWGAQLEAGAFPTSYIPTTSAQVTRAADVAVIDGTRFSNWYRQDEGTLYAEASFMGFPSTSNPVSAVLSDGTSNNHIAMLEYNVNSRIQMEVKTGGVVQAGLIAQSSISTNTFYKHSIAYKLNDISACASGGTIQTDTSATIPACSQLGIGTLGGGNFTNGHIKRITYYQRRLSDTELQALTA